MKVGTRIKLDKLPEDASWAAIRDREGVVIRGSGDGGLSYNRVAVPGVEKGSANGYWLIHDEEVSVVEEVPAVFVRDTITGSIYQAALVNERAKLRVIQDCGGVVRFDGAEVILDAVFERVNPTIDGRWASVGYTLDPSAPASEAKQAA